MSAGQGWAHRQAGDVTLPPPEAPGTYTFPLEPSPGSAIDPLVEESSWIALELLGASPKRVVSDHSVSAAAAAFDHLVEEAWLPGRVSLLTELRLETSPVRRLRVFLAVGVMGEVGSTAAEASAIGTLAEARLNARHLPYRVARVDARALLESGAGEHPHEAVIRQREVTVEAPAHIGDISVLSRWNPTADPWSSLMRVMLTREHPTAVRATVLPTEVTVADRLQLDRLMARAQDLRRDSDGSPDREAQADRLVATLIDLRASLSTPVMCVELAVSSAAALPQLFLRSVGACFTSEADVVRRQGHTAVAAQRLMVGGFAIEPPPPGRTMANRRGLPTRGGICGRELRDLVTLFENPLGFPIPVNHPLPTIDASVVAELPVPAVMTAGTRLGCVASGMPVGLPTDESDRHVLVTGATGTGKSAVLAAMMLDRLRQRQPFVLIDCHGSLSDLVVAHADQIGAPVTAVDVADPRGERIALLPRYRSRDDARAVEQSAALICDSVASSLPNPEWAGVRWSECARALCVVAAVHGLEFAAALELVHDDARLRAAVADDRVPVWAREALLNLHRASSEASDLRNWIVAKFTAFTTVNARRVLAPSGAGPTVGDLVADGATIIVNLSAFPTADAGLMGHLLLSTVTDAAMARPIGTGHRYVAFVDEAHRYPVASAERVVAEGRKFGLSLVFATQSLGLLPGSLAEAVSGVNVRLALRQAPASAAQIAPLMDVPATDLTDLPAMRGYVKIVGHPTCSLHIDPYPPTPPLRDKLRLDAIGPSRDADALSSVLDRWSKSPGCR